ncbi:hypothetical protein WICPIJ_009691 [Wickerhamomyces pijperi]|uniref:Metallo-beta-lactamase domain-containing protein n=1 Tax=Wickerhamomyces pijperi TaxID=599730 RepID=A0A9P8PM03_WICPI|nr:hypothetical protein WICPIJ_009691 [Wickerhamomyces pijperi]
MWVLPISLKAKIGLGLLATYTSYAAYVSYAANVEITRRGKRFQESKASSLAEEGSCCDHGHDDYIKDKYSSLTIAGRFENPFEEYRIQTLFEFFLSRVLELFEGKSRGDVPATETLREVLPVFTPDFELLQQSSLLLNNYHTFSDSLSNVVGLPDFKDRMTVTWLGQSCSFIQISGVNFLTDPIFSNHLIAPVIGPKRITPSPCEYKDLPKPDFILVSHNHPDHLDMGTVNEVKNSVTWVVPSGLRRVLAARGIHNTIELDWWEKVQIDVPSDKNNVYEIACTPAMHWSGRTLLDSNQSLWCSFLVLKNGKPIFFHCGDTGYVHDLFKMISEKYGEGVKLAMLPCGQYCPQWHQKPRHISPEECFKIHDDLKAKKMIGVHWGTFVLSSEFYLEPKLKIESLAKDLGKEDDCFIPQFGQTYVFDINDNDEARINENDKGQVTVRDGKSILVK